VKLTVEMYGLSPYTEDNSVIIEVKNGVGRSDLLRAVVREIPSLEGHVIQSDRLLETYGMYLNGRFIEQDELIEVEPDDRVVIILLATGG
jgi:hypothetical protein